MPTTEVNLYKFLKKESESFFEGGHNIYTPKDLIVKICGEIPHIVDNKTILVLFNVEFVITLVYTLKVNTKNITFYSDHVNKTKLVQKMGVNVINTLDTKMKFDIVVGNPPYDKNSGAKNTKLWYKFSELALSISNDIVAFVTPNNVVSNSGVNGEKLRRLISEKEYKFINATNHDNKIFKSVSVDTCHWIVSKNSVLVSVDPVILKNKKVLDVTEISIINKVVDPKHKKLQFQLHNGTISKSMLSVSGTEIYFSGNKLNYCNKKLEGVGVLKVVFPFSSSYHKMFITDKASGMLNMVFPISSQQEGKMILEYANSKLFRFVASRYKKTSGFTPFIKNGMVPDLRDKKNWSDAKLYAHFGLTQEEIDYIEANVK